MKPSIEQVNHLIQNRRSIYPKSFNDKVINKEIIDNILENGNWAPSHRQTEPWRFVVFTGKGLEKLADFQASYYKNNAEDFDLKKYNKLISKPLMCSHVIAIGMKRDDEERVPEIEEIEAVACAVQNMHLTATAHGVGAYWGTGGVTYNKEVNDFFGLETKDLLLGFLFLGYSKTEWPSPLKRGSVESKTHWVTE